ncbi:hypothetical protein [Pseudomonas sp. zfem002]|uniref:hypothetical protein n=1 Tax=Pseudomonas sp. zfem002 TaxID=3078197 RepID=UPI002927F0F8|nr:hypothetical protein [Pseudomonas sp. zfem002]MDU9391530.1 hypothetical protein [Pseudomonas sp. zfem002]
MDFPKSTPGVGLVDGRFVDENVTTGQPGSLIPAAWGNSVTTELLNVIRAAGYVPDEQNLNQLLSAIGELNSKAIRDRIASQDEVNDGSETGKLVTPKTQAVAFGRLWKGATELDAGVVKIATPHEVEGGEDTRKVVTPATLVVAVSKHISAIWKGATEAAFGVIKLASQTEVNEGWDTEKAVTSKTLSVKLGNLWQGATAAAFGVIKLASQTEVNEGWDTEKAVTSKTLSVKLGNLWQGATAAAFGVIKLASQTEVNEGWDTEKAVTSKTLSVKLGNLWQGATAAAFGVIKLASQTEVNEGWDTEKAVTSKTLSVKLGNLWQGATEAAFGVVQLASQAETNSGADDSKVVTPRKLRFGVSSSFGSRGHFAFPTWCGGWIINWGLETGIPQATDSVSSVGPTRDVTLSLAYPNQGFGALASMSFSTMGTRAAYAPGAALLSKSTLRLQNNYTGSAGDIFWISIGN